MINCAWSKSWSLMNSSKELLKPGAFRRKSWRVEESGHQEDIAQVILICYIRELLTTL